MNDEINTKSNPYFIPIAILIAGAMIAGSVLYSGGGFSQFQITPGLESNTTRPSEAGDQAIDKIKPITKLDHVRGNPNAPVTIVEFSDTECPFCKRFHPTIQQVVNEYDGQIAWVYRHFPLDQIHPKARKEAEATECANELGGNDKFWAYLDRLFEVTPSNNNLDPAELPNIAEYVGLNRSQFESCLDSGKYAQHIADDLADAINSGGQGTPYSVVIASNGKKFPLSGAQPYASVKQLIELALQEK